MLSRMKSIVLTLLILLVVVIGTVLNAMHGPEISRDRMDYSNVRAYDYIKNLGYKVVGFEGGSYILNGNIPAEVINGLGILNIDVSPYFYKLLAVNSFTVIKHIWDNNITAYVYSVENKVLGWYYVKYDYHQKLYYSLDSKHFEELPIYEQSELMIKYMDKWYQYKKDNHFEDMYNY